MNRRALEGGEFDWFALDADGNVGHFSTAGFGPIPKILLKEYDRVEGLDQKLIALPVICEAEGHLPGTIDDWLEMARRGLFSYDWQHWKGSYRRAATPSSPIKLDRLPAELKESIDILRFAEFRFPDLLEIRPELLCECE